MKRRVAIILGLIALGGLMNIATVLLATVWPPAAGPSRKLAFFSDEKSGWRMGRERGAASDRLVFFVPAHGPEFYLIGFSPPPHPSFSAAPHWSRVVQDQPLNGSAFIDFWIEDARGWPMLCMSSHSMSSHTVSARAEAPYLSVKIELTTDGIILDEPDKGSLWTARIFPLRPVWPGFIINTLFYALLLWLLFIVPFTARRKLRRRRGLCEQCAYPIGTWGTPVCTECGAAVRLQPAANKRLQS